MFLAYTSDAAGEALFLSESKQKFVEVGLAARASAVKRIRYIWIMPEHSRVWVKCVYIAEGGSFRSRRHDGRRRNDRRGHLWEATLQKLPHLDEVLAELKMRGYKLGVITNTVTSREEHVRLAMRRIDIEKYFDVVVTSVDLGIGKPDETIFLSALRTLGVTPEEAVMVGNRVDTDILGGNRAGMKTILLKWNDRHPTEPLSAQEKPTRTITSLEELPRAISEI